jgi:hypothetical protein
MWPRINMNKKFFVRYESEAGSDWSTTAFGLNLYSLDDHRNIGLNYPAFRDYSQVVQQYRRSEIRNQMFKTAGENPSTFLSVGVPIGWDGQTVSINAVDTNVIVALLDTGKYSSIQFAFSADEHPEGAGDLDVITMSGYYGRNDETGVYENCITGQPLSQYPSLSFWYSVYQIGTTNIYYMVVNPELLCVISDIDGTYNGVDYKLIGSDTDTFANELLSPEVTGGKLVGPNMIFAESDTVVINVVGTSVTLGSPGFYVKPEQIPTIDLAVESSVNYTVDNHILTLDLTGKTSAYVNYKWVTGTFLDFSREQLTKNFVIIK